MHLPILRRCLGLLYGAVAQGRLPAPPARDLLDVQPFWAEGRDPVIAVQHLARAMTEMYGLSVGTIVVTWEPNLKVAGCVELRGAPGAAGGDFFVDLSPRYRGQRRTVAAILAHEIAHIFLHRHGIAFPDILENELLTDCCAASWGFGPLMLNSFRIDVSRVGDTEHHRTHHLGYLTPEEVAWCITRRGLGGPSFDPDWLVSPAARGAWDWSWRRFQQETRTPPLVTAPWYRWPWYWLRRWWAGRRAAPLALPSPSTASARSARSAMTEALAERAVVFEGGPAGRVLIRCPRCCRALRLPLRRRGTIRCGNCQLAILCSS